MSRRLSSLLAVAGILALPATAAAAPAKKPAPQPAAVPEATVKVKVGNLDNGRAEIMQTVPVTGTLAPFVAGEKAKVTFYLDGRQLFSRNGFLRRPPFACGFALIRRSPRGAAPRILAIGTPSASNSSRGL